MRGKNPGGSIFSLGPKPSKKPHPLTAAMILPILPTDLEEKLMNSGPLSSPQESKVSPWKQPAIPKGKLSSHHQMIRSKMLAFRAGLPAQEELVGCWDLTYRCMALKIKDMQQAISKFMKALTIYTVHIRPWLLWKLAAECEQASSSKEKPYGTGNNYISYHIITP